MGLELKSSKPKKKHPRRHEHKDIEGADKVLPSRHLRVVRRNESQPRNLEERSERWGKNEGSQGSKSGQQLEYHRGQIDPQSVSNLGGYKEQAFGEWEEDIRTSLMLISNLK